MQETGTLPVQGNVNIVGTVHGAINTIVTRFANPQDFEFKQFVSQEQLDAYLRENNFSFSRKED